MVIVWFWVSNSPAEMPAGLRMPLVLTELAAEPAATAPPEISIPVCVPPPCTPAYACVANVAFSPSPELLMALIKPLAVLA
jgi:hypothetical protein